MNLRSTKLIMYDPGLLWISAFLLPVLLAPFVGAYEWEIEVADNGRQFSDMTDRSLHLDAQGHPHIAYGKDHLYYAFHDGVAWHYEVADSSFRVGRCASLALDESGNPHISCCEWPDFHANYDRHLKYVYCDASGWHTETVDAGGDVGYDSSIGLDGSGDPHISYYDDTNHDLKYVYRDGSGWHIETVDSEGFVQGRTSLALDKSAYPHISYLDNNYLKYAYRDASGWHTEIADTSGYAGGYTSIALDSEDLPHISYFAAPYTWELRYAHKDSMNWQIQVIDSLWLEGQSTSIAVDSCDNPHISYLDSDYTDLKYAHYGILGWHIETVDSEGNVGMHSSLALDESGSPHISYCSGAGLKYASRDASGWHIETVDRRGNAGQYTSLVLDESGSTHIGYYASGNLKYAYHDGSGWHSETADAAGDVGRYSSLALDELGYPHISYFRHVSCDLKYAYRDASGWCTETVDTGLDLSGAFTSLALDASGSTHISYYASGNLKYAYHDGSGWHTKTVASAGASWTSLALDGSDDPQISYCAWGLKYAYRDASGWHIETVDNERAEFSSLVLDQEGLPHISYAEYEDYGYWGVPVALKYACKESTGWHITIVDTLGDVGGHTSLALDNNGDPYISYCEWLVGVGGQAPLKLKHARRDGSGWHIETVDSSFWVGWYTSLALDGSGSPKISYYDYTNGDLRYAYAVDLTPLILTGSVVGDQLVLSWTPIPETAAYWVYGTSNYAYFSPGFAPDYQYRLDVLPSDITVWASANGIPDPDNNWTYLVMAVDDVDQEITRSNYCGEYDFGMDIP